MQIKISDDIAFRELYFLGFQLLRISKINNKFKHFISHDTAQFKIRRGWKFRKVSRNIRIHSRMEHCKARNKSALSYSSPLIRVWAVLHSAMKAVEYDRRLPTFRRNVLPSSSGPKWKPSKQHKEQSFVNIALWTSHVQSVYVFANHTDGYGPKWNSYADHALSLSNGEAGTCNVLCPSVMGKQERVTCSVPQRCEGRNLERAHVSQRWGGRNVERSTDS
jgi:hypothetical protein